MYFSRDYSYICADNSNLDIKVYYPENFDFSKKLPAIILFFGGGWSYGTPINMQPQAMFFATRGLIAITPDYRVYNKQKALPSDCVKDAKLAVKWVYDQSDILGIDKDKIVVGGNSAGGHLAICTKLLPPIDNEDIDVTNISKAQVLFSPALDFSKFGEAPKKYEGCNFEKISPYHNLKANISPTIIFHGVNDDVVPYDQSTSFCEKSSKLGNNCVLKSYKDKKHTLCSFKHDIISFADIMKESELFLKECGIL